MKKSRAQREAQLREAMEGILEELWVWEEGQERPNLEAMEEVVLRLRHQLGQAMLEVLVEGQEAGQPVEPPRCEECGEPMRNKGGKVRGVESRVGEVELERNYYYCARCRSGFFPPGPST